MLAQLLPILNNADSTAAAYIADNGVTLACHKGCEYCCYLRVDMFPHEASSIVQYILANFTETQISELRSRLEKHVDIVDGLTVQQHQTRNMPCPLLVNSQCSVYPVRPIHCRAYTSLDVQSCKYSFEHPRDMRQKRPRNQGLESLWDREKHNVRDLGSGKYGQVACELGGRVLSEITRATRNKTS